MPGSSATCEPNAYRDMDVATEHDMTTNRSKRDERADAIRDLRKMVRPGSRVYIRVTSVSRSGMSRTIRLFIPVMGKDYRTGKRTMLIRSIDGLAATALGCGWSDGIKTSGCGMDVCLKELCLLGRILWPEGGPGKASERHRRDAGLRTRDDGDGGYLLRCESL